MFAPLRLTPPSALALALGLTLLAAPLASARADAPSAEAAAEQRRVAAKEKFQQGVEAYKEQRFTDAVRLFLEADGLAPSANLSFNVARAYERLEDFSGALRWYRDFLRRNPSAPNAATVQERVAELSAKLAERGLQQVTLLSDPAGATVTLDGQPLGVTPLTRDLPPGQYRLRLRRDGYREHESQLTVAPDVARDVSLSLERAAAPPASAPLAASRQPLAQVPQSPRFGALPYVVLGAGGVSLLGALGFELGRRSADSAAADAPQTEFNDRYETMQSRQTVARVLAGVGGALVVAGGVLLYVDLQRKPGPSVALGCDARSCGLSARGRFQ